MAVNESVSEDVVVTWTAADLLSKHLHLPGPITLSNEKPSLEYKVGP